MFLFFPRFFFHLCLFSIFFSIYFLLDLFRINFSSTLFFDLFVFIRFFYLFVVCGLLFSVCSRLLIDCDYCNDGQICAFDVIVSFIVI